MPTCFVIMPISDHVAYPPGHFKRVYLELIRPACTSAGFEVSRADDRLGSNLIVPEIITSIVNSDLVVCDLSSRNANVLYELAVRHAIHKPVALLADEKSERVFDVDGLRRLHYDSQLEGDRLATDRESIAKAALATMREPVRSFFTDLEVFRGFFDGVRAFPTRAALTGDSGFANALSENSHFDIVALSAEVAITRFREQLFAALQRPEFTSRFLIYDPRRQPGISAHYDVLVRDVLKQDPEFKRAQAKEVLALAKQSVARSGNVNKMQVRAIGAVPLLYNFWLAGSDRGRPRVGHISAYGYDESRGGPSFRTTSSGSQLLAALQNEFDYAWDRLATPIDAIDQ